MNNTVIIKPIERTVTIKAVRVKSEYHYAHPAQVVEEVSERK